ncbi:uncharacterized protein LOC106166913 [Lingula anatina]|uniref:Uncharacterized protein LOC106166913 n=1 Tax=Lingula anatina TaxID=7574 RepID=A0A1S3IU16_LINAN|nr:uncharacterized protein LOC106166913 [Lingula anatina]|eukprot:XP_013401029.1 uncharacterized protein LOC106166913 [Lingula anatina]
MTSNHFCPVYILDTAHVSPQSRQDHRPSHGATTVADWDNMTGIVDSSTPKPDSECYAVEGDVGCADPENQRPLKLKIKPNKANKQGCCKRCLGGGFLKSCYTYTVTLLLLPLIMTVTYMSYTCNNENVEYGAQADIVSCADLGAGMFCPANCQSPVYSVCPQGYQENGLPPAILRCPRGTVCSAPKEGVVGCVDKGACYNKGGGAVPVAAPLLNRVDVDQERTGKPNNSP